MCSHALNFEVCLLARINLPTHMSLVDGSFIASVSIPQWNPLFLEWKKRRPK